DWAFDPFVLQEVDGYFRGRGTIDDKAMAASFVTNLILFAKEGFRPDRDIILALTADEELSDSPHDGAKWLLQNHRALVDAELAPLTMRPAFNAVLRTTCVATMLDAGHAENALPQTARATVNCRIMPDQAVADVERALVAAVDDPKVAVIPVGTAVASPPS